MKTRICAFGLAILMLGTTATTALANVDYELEHDIAVLETDTERLMDAVSDIPVYVTYIDELSSSAIEQAKMTADFQIKKEVLGDTALETEERALLTRGRAMTNYESVLLDEAALEAHLSSGLYTEAFERIEELINEGLTVNYININVPQSAATPYASNNYNDPAYWERNLNQLGRADGYNFLYSEVSSNVETSWKSMLGGKNNVNWKSIVIMVAKFTVNQITKSKTVRVITTAHTIISNALKLKPEPYSVTVGNSSGHFKGKLSGTLYMRTIYIQDKLNRVNGYAYYYWAHAQQYRSVQKYDLKYPTSKRTNTTYNYETALFNGASHTITTDTFYGSVSSLRDVIFYYENGFSANDYSEQVDVSSANAVLSN